MRGLLTPFSRHNPLALRLAGAILLVSLLVMLISIALFVVREYHQGTQRLEQNLAQIELTTLPGLSRSLWNFDEEQLRVQLNALVSLPDVEYAVIRWQDWNGGSKMLSASDSAAHLPQEPHRFALTYQRRSGEIEPLGTLELGISQHSLYQQLGQQTIFLVIFLAMQALISAVLIIILLRQLLTRRLGKLADATRQLTLSSLHHPIPRQTEPGNDELDNIAAALETMRLRLLEDIQARQSADQALLKERELRLDNEERRIRAESANDAKNTFMATMSHEIRTPLNGIIGLLDLLQGSPLNPRQAHYLKLMQQSSENLLAIINDILDFSKIEAGELKLEHRPVNLVGLIEDTLCAYAGQAEKKHLLLACELLLKDHQIIMGDEIRLRQILMNLISNAIKFTEQGHIIVRALDHPQGVRIEIEDTGIGISAQQQAGIFDAFAQADQSTARRFGGTGLGLSVCRSLSEIMQGTLSVDSIPGKGSTFSLQLPLTPAPDQPTLPDLGGSPQLVISEQDALQQPLTRMLNLANGRPLRGASLAMLDSAPASAIALIDINLLHGQTCTEATPSGWQDRAIFICHEDMDSPPLHYLRLPVTRTALYRLLAHETQPGQDTRAPATSPALPPLRVLVAEDNPVNRSVLQALLRSLSLPEATICDDGQAALEAYQQQRGQFDVIFMDVEMPGLDGPDATRAIRQYEQQAGLPPCPVIALTAHTLNSDARLVREAGINQVLNKPLRRHTLIQCLQQLSAQR
ncbi:MAG: ATP-binding protein [Pseudomonadales bacterium]|nr:ATP-binding protein [Pseudomonadales bacterium]